MPAPRKPTSEAAVARLREMVVQGVTRGQMAAELGVSRHVIDRLMHNEGLRSTARAATTPPPAHPERVPIGAKTTLPPLPSLQTEGD
jgi:hypothetical protein